MEEILKFFGIRMEDFRMNVSSPNGNVLLNSIQTCLISTKKFKDIFNPFGDHFVKALYVWILFLQFLIEILISLVWLCEIDVGSISFVIVESIYICEQIIVHLNLIVD
jgi:hypothetical protein